MEPTSPSVAVSSTPATPLPAVGFDPFTAVMNMLGGNSGISGGGFWDFLGTVWSVYVVIAFILCAIMLVMYAYASIRRWQYFGLTERSLREMEELYDAQYRGLNKRNRMDDILARSASDNPNDWKLAIIEADVILDGLLKERGYAGSTLGERLKSVSPQQLNTLNDAWEAHKVRNLIAHEGPDFVLTQRKAEETINRYRRVFAEFGIL